LVANPRTSRTMSALPQKPVVKNMEMNNRKLSAERDSIQTCVSQVAGKHRRGLHCSGRSSERRGGGTWRHPIAATLSIETRYSDSDRGAYVREHNSVRTELNPVARLDSFDSSQRCRSHHADWTDGEVVFDFFVRGVLYEWLSSLRSYAYTSLTWRGFFYWFRISRMRATLWETR